MEPVYHCPQELPGGNGGEEEGVRRPESARRKERRGDRHADAETAENNGQHERLHLREKFQLRLVCLPSI